MEKTDKFQLFTNMLNVLVDDKGANTPVTWGDLASLTLACNSTAIEHDKEEQ